MKGYCGPEISGGKNDSMKKTVIKEDAIGKVDLALDGKIV